MIIHGVTLTYDYDPDTGEYRMWNELAQRWSVAMMWTAIQDDLLPPDYMDWLPER